VGFTARAGSNPVSDTNAHLDLSVCARVNSWIAFVIEDLARVPNQLLVLPFLGLHHLPLLIRQVPSRVLLSVLAGHHEG
jgi:hypothetical protein